MGLLSFLWASSARHKVNYLEERVMLLENRVSKLEIDLIPLMTKKG